MCASTNDTKKSMSKPVPINSSNALEFLAFVIVLSKDLSERDDSNLLSLETKLKDDLPNFSQNYEVETKIENGQITSQNTKKSGITLQVLNQSNAKPTWILSVNKNQIVVQCLDYDSWKNTCSKATKFIKAVIDVLDYSSAASSLSIQCVDKFIQSSDGDYSQFDLFAKDTKYLTPNSSEIGKLWHIHQGWFKQIQNGSKILNVLNIGTLEKESNLTTTIDHVSQHFFLEPILLSDSEGCFKIFDELYDNNKNIIQELLKKEQLKAIGI